jgi:hypothetical protein
MRSRKELVGLLADCAPRLSFLNLKTHGTVVDEPVPPVVATAGAGSALR